MDSKGLRLRSAVRIVEPRITSASMLTRVNITPGQLPPLRGRSTTRKTNQSMKKRAASLRDSTHPFSSGGDAAAKQAAVPERVHLPNLLSENQASAAAPHVRTPGQCVSFTPKRPAIAEPSKPQRRSALSEPPSHVGGHTAAATSNGAANIDSQGECAQEQCEASAQGQGGTPPIPGVSSSGLANTPGNIPCVAAEPYSQTAADGGRAEGRAVARLEHASLSQSGHAQLDEVVGAHNEECSNMHESSSEVCDPCIALLFVRVDMKIHPASLKLPWHLQNTCRSPWSA